MKDPFPEANLHFMEQRTDDWFEARKGNLTASEFGAWLLKSDKTSAKARLNAQCKLLAQIAQCDEAPNFENWAMARGTELEPVACSRFEEVTGYNVMPVGFAKSKHGAFGVSPDGLLPDIRAGLEIKCPIPATHVKYLLSKSLPVEYFHQVHGQMAVLGSHTCHFFSYCPNLPDLHLIIERNETTEKMEEALKEFSGELIEKRDEIKAMWDKQFKEDNHE